MHEFILPSLFILGLSVSALVQGVCNNNCKGYAGVGGGAYTGVGGGGSCPSVCK